MAMLGKGRPGMSEIDSRIKNSRYHRLGRRGEGLGKPSPNGSPKTGGPNIVISDIETSVMRHPGADHRSLHR